MTEAVQHSETGGREASRPRVYFVARHAALVRLTHWLNVVCFVVLLMSGLQIFNAHPALYWGEASDFPHPFVSIAAKPDSAGVKRGVTSVAGHAFDTTGVLGLFALPDGRANARAFPTWATLPSFQSLADGRRWHFFFAWALTLNGAIYLLYGLLSRHVWRDLVPTGLELKHIGRTVWDHLRLRFPHGEEARRYNVIQQITYLIVIWVMFPLLILAGLAMSPRLDAAWPWLPALFGGRQSARTAHFLLAFGLVAFVFVHVVMVFLSGPWNNIRSMVTGRYRIREAPGDD
jgi:thiosulfate reductase cytochrome b subunit